MLTIFGGAPTPLSPTTASSPHRVLRNRLSYSLPNRCDAARLRTGEYARRDRRGAKVKIRKPAPNADHSACRWDCCGVQSTRPPQDGTDSAAWSSSAFLSNAQSVALEGQRSALQDLRAGCRDGSCEAPKAPQNHSPKESRVLVTARSRNTSPLSTNGRAGAGHLQGN